MKMDVIKLDSSAAGSIDLDDAVFGFQYEAEGRTFLKSLRERVEAYGLSPKQYIQAYRLNKVHRLLLGARDQGLNVSDAANANNSSNSSVVAPVCLPLVVPTQQLSSEQAKSVREAAHRVERLWLARAVAPEGCRPITSFFK